MKRFVCLLVVSVSITFVTSSSKVATASINPLALVTAAIKKAIKAVDLKIQRLQNKTIWLQNAQKLLENKLSQLKLDEIADWSQRQREQYQRYYDELGKAKLAISQYQRIKEIVQKQARLTADYQRTWNLLKSDGHFQPHELGYMSNVYDGILKQSSENLQQVLKAVNSFTYKMSDAERLQIINDAAERVEKNYDDLKAFNRQNVMMSLQRTKSQQDIDAVKKFYGLQ